MVGDENRFDRKKQRTASVSDSVQEVSVVHEKIEKIGIADGLNLHHLKMLFQILCHFQEDRRGQ